MRRILALSAFACLLAGPAFGASSLCGGRVEVLAISPKWHEHAPGLAATGLTVAVANRSGEAILLQPVLTTGGGRPQMGLPLMLTRRGETVFALRVPEEQSAGLPPEALLRGLGASCRMG
ncbi:hypothetical protein KTR66_14785 [Roseococcus sp. SDR]|uniref:hypothetical protein n=1 Tax=Roseococcus sp. SDR TaxID=2835532 RepID=UPI001BCD1363|nr:hypothetical protein [Roseococcus sp. SDR]MBS7791267.1 hypothetical protein [Roseococcus sp. SDR]MBV1846581.1 hypothetical protein [Roseococcus sp. SDR]